MFFSISQKRNKTQKPRTGYLLVAVFDYETVLFFMNEKEQQQRRQQRQQQDFVINVKFALECSIC